MSVTVPIRSADEARGNASFEALMWALSRPGHIKALPRPGEPSLINALIDRECRVFCADPLLMPQILKTGAEIAMLDNADHVFAGTLKDVSILKELPIGSDLYPDDGATLIAQATLGESTNLRLRGPGVDGSCDVSIGGLPEGFWEMRKQVMRYPTGFELLLVDGDQLMAIPRSTDVEVL
ncbi:methylphosphonate degradation complex subunit PhnH [Shimia isoporae]|uniref:Methylphosphonate degradation complex subunit PhnH n=1 Tax=Shimia isoporae TaxID=647720 RepID=A0A4R1NNW2_9RHOB|nr:phosphonate C-P lyase system protein PhnH [Shimia isoporae]TCL08283.1 methylphosphonate degradation complex subunit PhnH [Shimia isoporae]